MKRTGLATRVDATARAACAAGAKPNARSAQATERSSAGRWRRGSMADRGRLVSQVSVESQQLSMVGRPDLCAGLSWLVGKVGNLGRIFSPGTFGGTVGTLVLSAVRALVPNKAFVPLGSY